MKISILITTMNDKIKKVKKELLPQLKKKNVEVIISHQITESNIKPEINSLGVNVKYFFMYDKGLSKNRNNALKYASGDICVVCDDDVRFVKDFYDIIFNAYLKNKEADIITFQSLNLKNRLRKNYNLNKFRHNWKSILSVSSIEITFKRRKVLSKKLYFDESFGLGAKYNSGEENIFLKDSLTRGLKLISVPSPINLHPHESSGQIYSRQLIISRIKLFKRMFGFFGGIFAVFYFTIFHYKFYRKKFSLFRFFVLSLKSVFN
ncbi:MAG: glycosyltransferase [Nanoarchaeota archaeon]